MVIWLTGLSGAGKTTVAKALAGQLSIAVVIDGDEIRKHRPSGFDKADRDANVLAAAEMATAVVASGGIAICSLISPVPGNTATGSGNVR